MNRQLEQDLSYQETKAIENQFDQGMYHRAPVLADHYERNGQNGKSIKILTIGADNGDTTSQCKLAEKLLDIGECEEAIKRFKQADDQGHKYAAYMLGLLYELGQCVNKNLDTALYYFKRSNTSHSNYEIAYLKLMSTNPAERSEGRSIANNLSNKGHFDSKILLASAFCFGRYEFQKNQNICKSLQKEIVGIIEKCINDKTSIPTYSQKAICHVIELLDIWELHDLKDLYQEYAIKHGSTQAAYLKAKQILEKENHNSLTLYDTRKENNENPFDILKKTCSQKNIDACLDLAQINFYGSYGNAINIDKALEYFTIAAKLGSTEAKFWLIKLKQHTPVAEGSISKLFTWISKILEKITLLPPRKSREVKFNDDEIKFVSSLAKEKHLEANIFLCKHYKNINLNKAEHYCIEASKQDDSFENRYNLAKVYERQDRKNDYIKQLEHCTPKGISIVSLDATRYYLDNDNLDKAIEHYFIFLQHTPTNEFSIDDFFVELMQKGKCHKLVDYIEINAKDFINNHDKFEAFSLLGNAYYHGCSDLNKNTTKSLEYYKSAIELRPDDDIQDMITGIEHPTDPYKDFC